MLGVKISNKQLPKRQTETILWHGCASGKRQCGPKCVIAVQFQVRAVFPRVPQIRWLAKAEV